MFFKIVKTLPFKIFNTWFNVNLISFCFIRDRLSYNFIELLKGFNVAFVLLSSIFIFRIIEQKLFRNISCKETIRGFISEAYCFNVWFSNHLKSIFRLFFGTPYLILVMYWYKYIKKKYSDNYVIYLNIASILFVKFVIEFNIYFF